MVDEPIGSDAIDTPDARSGPQSRPPRQGLPAGQGPRSPGTQSRSAGVNVAGPFVSAGGVIVLGGWLLPWLAYTTVAGATSVNGMDAGGFGLVVLGAACVLVLGGFGLLVQRGPAPMLRLLAILAALVVLGVVLLLNLFSHMWSDAFWATSIGTGAYVMAVGAAVGIFASLGAGRGAIWGNRRRGSTAARPAPGRPARG